MKKRELDTLFLSQSRIKWSIIKGEDIKPCPHRLLRTRYKREVSDLYNNAYQAISPLHLGNYFDEKILGKTAYGDSVLELPKRPITNEEFSKKLKEGKNYTAQERIDGHAFAFNELCKARDIEVSSYNVQVPIIKRLKHPYTGDIYYWKGVTDIFPTTIKGDKGSVRLCIIDIKTTKDVHNAYFNVEEPLSTISCYGNIEELEQIQAHSYLWMIEDFDYRLNCTMNPDHSYIYNVINEKVKKHADLHEVVFIYWVFGYKNDNLDENRAFYCIQYDKGKRADFFESVRKCLSLENEYIESGWPKIPSYKNCKYCPLNPKWKGCIDMKGTKAEKGAPGDCDMAYNADPSPKIDQQNDNKMNF